MTGPYINAVETRLRWLNFSQQYNVIDDKFNNEEGEEINNVFRRPLSNADTFYMNAHFCRLVSHAQESIPQELCFDIKWPQARWGWLYLEELIQLGGTKRDIRAIAWEFIPAGGRFVNAERGGEFAGYVPPDSMNVLTYGEYGRGFSPCHSFVLTDGESLGEVQARHAAARFPSCSPVILRWCLAAFHLMSLKMSVTISQKVDRAVRRRAQKQGQQPPDIIKVITLRRLEETRKREAPNSVEWHWQWEVRGHWRSQFYPSENIHKPVFVEAYIKGPTDRPFKSPGLKLFAAVR